MRVIGNWGHNWGHPSRRLRSREIELFSPAAVMKGGGRRVRLALRTGVEVLRRSPVLVARGVDSGSGAAPVTHQDQGQEGSPVRAPSAPGTRSAPANGRCPVASMASAHSTELVAARWFHPSGGSRPRRLSPRSSGEGVWVGRRGANQKRRARNYPLLWAPAPPHRSVTPRTHG